MRNKLLLTSKRQDMEQFFRFWKTVLNIVWIRNRNRKFSKVGTGTATGYRTVAQHLRLVVVGLLPAGTRTSCWKKKHRENVLVIVVANKPIRIS